MLVTKRGFFVAYVNVLLIAAVITVAVIKTQSFESVEKRQGYIDFIGLECSEDPSKCGEHGDCLPIYQIDPNSGKMCVCHDGWTSFDGYCDYLKKPQFVCRFCFSSNKRRTPFWLLSLVVPSVLTGK